MGSKRFVSTRDLGRHGCNMHVQCQNCDHRGELTPWALEEHAKKDRRRYWMASPTELRILARRLRCSQCGSRRVDWGPMGR